MFRLFECCALSFFERFVLSFSLKIERFVSDSAEIWICGLYSSKGCNEVWLATAANSVKVADFKLNNKAGLCYSNYGDSVGLRGIIEIITDDNIRKEMWQDWLINHFPYGPTDPNFVLLHFIGKEATFWINGEFSHEKL